MSSSASPNPLPLPSEADPSPFDAAATPVAVNDDQHHHEDALPSPPAAGESRRERLQALAVSWAISLASIAVGLMLWHLATVYSIEWYIRFNNVPSPLKVGQALWTQLEGGTFYLHIAVSMRRIAYAYGLAT